MSFTDDVRKKVQDAESKHEIGNHKGAIEIIQKIEYEYIQEGTPPDQADFYCLWGYCLEDLEYYFTARKGYMAALKSLLEMEVDRDVLINGEREEEAQKEQAAWRKGQEEWREQDKGLAKGYFGKLKGLNIGNEEDREKVVMAARVFNAYGDLLAKEKQPIETEEQYKRAKDLCGLVIEGNHKGDESKAEAHYRSAYALMRLKDYKKSEEDYKEAIKLYKEVKDGPKKRAKAYNGLRNLYLHQNCLENAIKEYKNAIKSIEGSCPIPPIIYKYTPPLNNMAYTLYLLGDYKEAESWCTKARHSGEESAEFFDTLGCVYSGLKRYKKSKEAFEEALKRKKRNPNIRNNYGDSLRIMGFYEEAKKELEEAKKQDEFLAAPYSNLGDLYREQDNIKYNIKEAESYYIEARKLDPDLPDARFGLADCYVTQAETDKKPGLYSTALQEMNLIPKLARRWPERNPRFYLLRGYIYWKLGKYGNAKEDFKKCKDKAKVDEEVFFKARENLKALQSDEPSKLMTWGGLVLAGIAGAVLIAITIFYLSFPSIEAPSPSEKILGAGAEAAK